MSVVVQESQRRYIFFPQRLLSVSYQEAERESNNSQMEALLHNIRVVASLQPLAEIRQRLRLKLVNAFGVFN